MRRSRLLPIWKERRRHFHLDVHLKAMSCVLSLADLKTKNGHYPDSASDPSMFAPMHPSETGPMTVSRERTGNSSFSVGIVAVRSPSSEPWL